MNQILLKLDIWKTVFLPLLAVVAAVAIAVAVADCFFLPSLMSGVDCLLLGSRAYDRQALLQNYFFVFRKFRFFRKMMFVETL